MFHDQTHYDRFTQGLADEVQRSGWIVLAYCWMPNHILALIQTPEPNLAQGMQHWLSGYANWYAKRHGRTGHRYQKRYKAFLVEDAGYYWTLSRYIHLNPCNGSKPLATDPEAWPHSSFGGYARKSKRVSWIAYDQFHTYWVLRLVLPESTASRISCVARKNDPGNQRNGERRRGKSKPLLS